MSPGEKAYYDAMGKRLTQPLLEQTQQKPVAPSKAYTTADAYKIFDKVEKKHNIQPGLLGKIYKAESGGGKQVLSKKGAQGPFQFMPGTAKQYKVKDPFDLEQAAEGAGQYLSNLNRRFNRDVRKVVASYNWGESNVGKYGLEKAPKETRDYLAIVVDGKTRAELKANPVKTAKAPPGPVPKGTFDPWSGFDSSADTAYAAKPKPNPTSTALNTPAPVTSSNPLPGVYPGYTAPNLAPPSEPAIAPQYAETTPPSPSTASAPTPKSVATAPPAGPSSPGQPSGTAPPPIAQAAAPVQPGAPAVPAGPALPSGQAAPPGAPPQYTIAPDGQIVPYPSPAPAQAPIAAATAVPAPVGPGAPVPPPAVAPMPGVPTGPGIAQTQTPAPMPPFVQQAAPMPPSPPGYPQAAVPTPNYGAGPGIAQREVPTPQAPPVAGVGAPGVTPMPYPPVQPVPGQGTPPTPTPQVAQAPGAPPSGIDPWVQAGTQLDPKIAPGVAQTPEELDRRRSGWKTFISRLETDPNLQAMFLKMGTQLMQPVQPGQSSAGHVGAALQSGVDYAVAGSERRRKGELEAGRADREERALSSDLTSQEQGRTISGRQEDRAQSKHQPELDSLSARLKSAKTQDEVAQRELEIVDFKLRNKDATFASDQADTKATTRLKNAQAGYYEGAVKGGTGADAAAAKATLTQEGAANAVAYWNRIVKAENDRKNGKKQPGDAGYVTMEKTELDVYTTIPGSLKEIIDARREAGGLAPLSQAAAPTAAPPRVDINDKMIQDKLDEMKAKAKAKAGKGPRKPAQPADPDEIRNTH